MESSRHKAMREENITVSAEGPFYSLSRLVIEPAASRTRIGHSAAELSGGIFSQCTQTEFGYDRVLVPRNARARFGEC